MTHPAHRHPFQPAWTREEAVLLADLYVNVFERRVPAANHPEIVALSGYLRRAPWHDYLARPAGFRSPASVSSKLAELQVVDPDRELRPRRTRPVFTVGAEVLKQFRRRPMSLAAEAARLREYIAFHAAALAPEIATALATTERLAGRRASPGRELAPAERQALVGEAMRRAVSWLASDGWSVEHASASDPYDLLAVRGPDTLHVTVKATTGDGSGVLLTPGEVMHAQLRYPDIALFVAHSLELVPGPAGDVVAAGGAAFVVRPWLPTDDALSATGWSHAINPATATPV